MTARNADVEPNQRIMLRIGINVGDVIVEDEDIYGDGVNVAARLESLAPAGGICISGTVHDQVELVQTMLDAIGQAGNGAIPQYTIPFEIITPESV